MARHRHTDADIYTDITNANTVRIEHPSRTYPEPGYTTRSCHATPRTLHASEVEFRLQCTTDSRTKRERFSFGTAHLDCTSNAAIPHTAVVITLFHSVLLLILFTSTTSTACQHDQTSPSSRSHYIGSSCCHISCISLSFAYV